LKEEEKEEEENEIHFPSPSRFLSKFPARLEPKQGQQQQRRQIVERRRQKQR
jgi:hypothetical protein